MSYPYPAPYPPPYQPVPRPLSTSTTGPKVLTFIGIAVLVLSIGIGVGGGVLVASGVRTMDETIQEVDSEVDAAAVATIQPGQTETVTLDAYTSYTLWIEPDGSTGPGSLPVVTDPTGDSVLVTTSNYTNSSWETDESVEGWRFTSQESGLYQITAPADGPALRLVLGVQLESLIDGATAVASTLGGGLLVATGVGLGAVGLGLLIGGAFWWSARSRNARRVTQTGQPAF